MNIITEAYSLRDNDLDVWKKISRQLTPTNRPLFRNRVYNKQRYPSERDIKNATTSILQAIFEGNHLLEYIKDVTKNVKEAEFKKILKAYNLPELKTIRNRFASGVGEDTSDDILFSLATVQQISVLKCLINFLEFCLENDRPLQYFYESDENLDKYIDLASETLKSRKSANKEQKLIPSLFDEDKEKLENYINTAKEYLKNNPQKSLPQADFHHESEQKTIDNDNFDDNRSQTLENNTSSILEVFLPKSRMAQIITICIVSFIVLGLTFFSFNQYNEAQASEKIETLVQQTEHPNVVREKITKLLQNDEISKDFLIYIISQVAEQDFLKEETIPSFVENKINDYFQIKESGDNSRKLLKQKPKIINPMKISWKNT
ncbi:hypothetical protein AB835_10840 [Candidatus Endobugula sertula]|uniref:Uncharacterized protein n=1 Tax=Candidatus Endobugula sertula TaxID=62101 RepID=A0A1D2QNB1_9GAMM|nr:hypothetical protein AB835_10840 [Candidatus Endobugula sertula]